ncbi:glutamyl-tRNA reductase [Eggerthellaceae bacterium zg-997]|nr:glutamyl-tRNA reductase [Eggerthellaceae bacterium zg-997]
MSIVAMGASYKSASLEQRERIALADDQVPAALDRLLACEGVTEAVVLSTCNRTEAYVEAKNDRLGVQALEHLFGVAEEGLAEGGLYLQRGMGAVRHLFRVACSLDSMVLGEAQILGQVKRAFEASSTHGACHEVLTRLFKAAIGLGKRVRTETAIGADSVSLSTAAYRAAATELGGLRNRPVLLVGAGEMARLAAAYLREGGAHPLYVVSRTIEHARQLADQVQGEARPFDERYRLAARCDAVFSMTAAPDAVIEGEPLARAREEAGTAGRPCAIVDQSVPRDVQPACADLPGVALYDIERLGSIIDEGMGRRMEAAREVERLAAEAESAFLSWMQERSVVPTIREMYEKGDQAVERELARACRTLAAARGQAISDDERATLEAFGKAVVKKLLHGPSIRLRKEAQSAESFYYTSSARYLFGLDTHPAGTVCNHCTDPSCHRGEGCSKHRAKAAGEAARAAASPAREAKGETR